MSEPIRILQVLAEMNRGGAETMIMNLYRHIDRAKIQFDFIVHTQKECAFDDEIEQLGGRIYRIPRYTGKNHFNYIKAWKVFFINHPEYRLIHGHVRSTATIYLLIARKYGLKTIVHSHSTASRGNITHRIIKRIMQFPIKYIADYMFACSIEAGRWLFGKNFNEDNRFILLKNAIDIDRYLYNEGVRKSVRKEFNIDNKFVLGHIGSFSYPKNHKFLIDVFYEVKKVKNDAVLMLVGDGDLLLDIKNKVNGLGLEDSVIFTGLRSDVHELLQSMDLLVFPSIFEGLPVTLIEAQAAGLKSYISDSITNDIMITELIEKIPLDSGAISWAKKILEDFYFHERKNYRAVIAYNGYDINKTSQEYQDFCIELFKSTM